MSIIEVVTFKDTPVLVGGALKGRQGWMVSAHTAGMQGWRAPLCQGSPSGTCSRGWRKAAKWCATNCSFPLLESPSSKLPAHLWRPEKPCLRFAAAAVHQAQHSMLCLHNALPQVQQALRLLCQVPIVSHRLCQMSLSVGMCAHTQKQAAVAGKVAAGAGFVLQSMHAASISYGEAVPLTLVFRCSTFSRNNINCMLMSSNYSGLRLERQAADHCMCSTGCEVPETAESSYVCLELLCQGLSGTACLACEHSILSTSSHGLDL